MRLKLLFLILLLTNLLPLAAQRGTVKGRVWNARNNEALIGAVVRMEGTKRATVTDSVGNYVFKNVAPGFYHLAVQLLGFENKRTEEFQVLGNQTAFVDVELGESAFSLTEAVVKSDTQAKRAESPLSVSRLEVQQIEKSAGMNRDVSKLIQTLPGVVSTDANRNDLLVRGGGPAENVFYLEGIELPVINHFSTQGAAGGAVGILNPDFMSAVDFYTGAFPANRPNALSSVMDIRMKEGSRDRLHTKVSLGASDASVTLDGPINARSSFIVSARQSYLKVLFKWFGLPFLPTYNDFQLKYNYRIGTHSSLTVIGLASIDHMRLNTELDESAQEIRRFLLNVLPVYDQWHYTLGAVYKVAATTHTDRWVLSRNFLDNGSHKYPGNDASQPKLFDYQSQESENKLRFERTFWTLPFKLNVGAGVQHARYFNRTQRYRIEAGVPTVDHYESNLHLFAYSAFAQASKAWWQQRLQASFGVNLMGNTYNRAMRNPLTQLAPRLSLTYALNAQTKLSANVGRYAQQPSYTTMGYKTAAGNFANRETLKYLIAYHGVVGVDYQPNSGFSLSIEGFYKAYRHYPISILEGMSLASKGAAYAVLGDEAVVSSGRGRAYGAEAVARLTLPQGLTASATITLFRSEFTNLKGQYQPSSWDTGHIINLMAGWKLPHNWSIAARWRRLGGAPYTPIDAQLSAQKAIWRLRNSAYLDYARFNSLRLPAAHQLDLRVDKEFYFRQWAFNLYFDVQNVYRSGNPMAPIYTNLSPQGQPMTDPADNDRYLLRQFPNMRGTVLPAMGVMVKF